MAADLHSFFHSDPAALEMLSWAVLTARAPEVPELQSCRCSCVDVAEIHLNVSSEFLPGNRDSHAAFEKLFVAVAML